MFFSTIASEFDYAQDEQVLEQDNVKIYIF